MSKLCVTIVAVSLAFAAPCVAMAKGSGHAAGHGSTGHAAHASSTGHAAHATHVAHATTHAAHGKFE